MSDAAQTAPRTQVDVSGISTHLGYRSFLEEGGACEMEVGAEHLNRLGVLHGGLMSLLLDNACALAIRTAVGRPDVGAVTVSLTVNFIQGTGPGRVVATGRCTGGGRKLKFAEAQLHDAQGQLLATGTATFKLPSGDLAPARGAE
ncbi:MAG: PaaI family thioesterase [Sulfitobacter sp.]